jgi:hypothetical protein
MPKPRTWFFLALGTLVLLVGLAVLVVGAGAWFFASHVTIEPASGGRAEESLADVRKRFEGQTPLIEITPGGTVSTAELQRRRATYAGPLPETLYLVAWSEGDEKIIRISFPFWLLRLQSEKSMKIDIDGFQMEQLGVTNEDIQMAGPALVLDGARHKSHVILWTE